MITDGSKKSVSRLAFKAQLLKLSYRIAKIVVVIQNLSSALVITRFEYDGWCRLAFSSLYFLEDEEVKHFAHHSLWKTDHKQ